jgi:hypothetical protein
MPVLLLSFFFADENKNHAYENKLARPVGENFILTSIVKTTKMSVQMVGWLKLVLCFIFWAFVNKPVVIDYRS